MEGNGVTTLNVCVYKCIMLNTLSKSVYSRVTCLAGWVISEDGDALECVGP